MQPRLGGPLGAHSHRGGVWFDPAPWAFIAATVVWIVTMARQNPCTQHVAGKPVDAFTRLCYSDIPVLYQNRGFAKGELTWGAMKLEYPVLTDMFAELARLIARGFGVHVSSSVTAQQTVDGAAIFFAVNSVLLGICFLALVSVHLLLGRDSAAGMGRAVGARTRSWDAMFIAGAPVVCASGLINWDLFAVALTSIALLSWAVRRPGWSGVWFGLAIAAGVYPVLILGVLWLLCLRAGQLRAWTLTVMSAAASWAVIDLPVALLSPSGFTSYFSAYLHRGADLGSLWYVASLAGITLAHVGWISSALFAVGLIAISYLTLSAPRRPRVGQIGLLVLIALLVSSRVYSPQFVLWLLPFVVLARPVMVDWAAFTIAELLYWGACWAHLDGSLSPGDSSPDVLYWAATFLRVGVEVWLATRVIHDVRNPWDDPVRTGLMDDPVGGVLDHAPDAVRMPLPDAEDDTDDLDLEDRFIDDEDHPGDAADLSGPLHPAQPPQAQPPQAQDAEDAGEVVAAGDTSDGRPKQGADAPSRPDATS